MCHLSRHKLEKRKNKRWNRKKNITIILSPPMAPHAHFINYQGHTGEPEEWVKGMNACAWGVHRRPTYVGSKGYSLAAGQNIIPLPRKKFYFLLAFCKKDHAQDGPRRRRKALGKVFACPEDWMALKRKPRNSGLFVLWRIGLICKIEAGFRLV